MIFVIISQLVVSSICFSRHLYYSFLLYIMLFYHHHYNKRKKSQFFLANLAEQNIFELKKIKSLKKISL